MQLLLERAGLPGLPQALDGIPVTLRVTGRLIAFSDPTKRQRPAPMGFSVGHPEITAGTIGARVRDALGRVYILSNNHVLANSNGATVGDPEYQPGTYDGGTAADQIATLSDFQTINFAGGTNTIDAAIALSDTGQLDNTTPLDDGYGMPNATIYGDANGDGLFDDRNALLGLHVQKYGRTTHLTHGQITAVNATLTVCYDGACLRSARYVDQLIIEPGGFSAGGDSGSLIVTDDGNLNPVALLFAGSATVTIANRIDLVLNRFGVTIDGFAPPPPGPLTDVAVIGITGPSAAVQGSPASVTVTIKNFGNQDVTAAFDVVLQDTTAHVTVGTQSVPGLAVGASATLTFAWTPTTTGNHTLVGSHTLSDDKAVNNQRFTTIPVNAPVTDIAVTGFSGPTEVIVGHGVNIGVTVANVGNRSVTGTFAVTLQDSTAGVTLGTQTVAGLGAGASTLLVFSWNTTNAALGGHT
ncbi:MAG: CARDB domain-containing protein, partial [Mycobacterium sp.]